MPIYLKQYALIDPLEDLVEPIQVVDEATLKNTGKRCLLPDGTVDPEYYAKKQFGVGNYKKVKFEKDIPLHHFKNTIKAGKAERDEVKITKAVTKRNNRNKKIIEIGWVKSIRGNLDIDIEENWSRAEKKISRNIMPSEADFEAHNTNYVHS